MSFQRLTLPAAALLAASATWAQSSMEASFPQPSWVALPGATPISVHNPLEGPTGPVAGKPFSATEVRHTVQTLSDGTRVDNTDRTRFWRDTDGRMRAQSPDRVFLYDPVAGFTASLFPSRKMYEKSALPASMKSINVALVGPVAAISRSSETPAERDTFPPSGTHRSEGKVTARWSSEDLPPIKVGGIRAKGLRMTAIVPAGTFGNDRDMKVVDERWYSTEWSLLVKSVNSDPRYGVTTYELTDIVLAPPDPALFKIPGDYTVYEGRRK
jgi:hypothetical protein